jgi:integrase/recombinase XerD
MLERYAEATGLERKISPRQLPHFLLTWLEKLVINDALVRPYSVHASRQSLEIYSWLAIGEAQRAYE